MWHKNSSFTPTGRIFAVLGTLLFPIPALFAVFDVLVLTTDKDIPEP
jgi:hypothetical protein